MENIIVVAVLAVIVGAAAVYVYRQKKKGNMCIGCPHAGQCNGSCQEEK